MQKRFSLLYPEGEVTDSMVLEDQVIQDLELENLITFMTPGRFLSKLQSESIRKILLHPSRDKDTIKYRLDISGDLLKYPEIFTAFERLVPIIETLSYFRSGRFSNQSPLYSLVFRLGELESYVGCIDTLKEAFKKINPDFSAEQPLADGLKALYRIVQEVYENEDFLHLRKSLPELAAKIRNNRSITVGINLDDNLRPVEASLVSINKERVSGTSSSIFSQLIKNRTEELNGLAPLHSRDNPLMSTLFKDLSDVLKRVCEPVQKALDRYILLNTHFFTGILEELIFYISGVSFLRKLQEEGLPVCKPEVVHPAERITVIEDNYNINLFIRMHKKGDSVKEKLVTNRVSLGPEGRIVILTGPNQGGKTVYTQGIGLTQILFQSGLCIPGRQAAISPADNIFTHFQIEEQIVKERGRFADEAKRLHDCIKQSTSNTLILMNESFASTNYSESLYIAEDIMKIFRILGVRTVFSTHFHDLAMQVESINRRTQGMSKLISMVSVVQNEDGEKVNRTYKIMPGPPEGKSYAREIAYKYGICFEQLEEMIKPAAAVSSYE
jgi:DNA mismatch repair protein MutS